MSKPLDHGGLLVAALITAGIFLKNCFSAKRKSEVNTTSVSLINDAKDGTGSENSLEESEKEDKGETVVMEEKEPTFMEEAILQAIEEGVDPNYFRPCLDDDDRSLSPTVKISRFFDRNTHKEARKVDILFPIPISIAMSGMDMGKYQFVTGDTKLPGPSAKQFNQKLFWSAFNFKNGYVIDKIMRLLPCLDESYIDTDIEGHYFVNYFVWDRESSRYFYQQKIICGVNHWRRQELDNAWEGKSKFNEPIKQYLTEVFEKFVLDKSPLSSNIINPLSLERGRRVEDIDIDYVILDHRVSIVIADDDHPTGITPYQLALLFKYFESDLEISDGLPNSNKFEYKNPTIYDEEALSAGRLAVYSIDSEDDSDYPKINLEWIDDDYVEEEEEKKNSESKPEDE
jgi:hypothetical protein